MPINYSKSKIFKLTGSGMTYFFTTTSTIQERKRKLKASGNEIVNTILHDSLHDIIHVEDFTCNSKEELNNRLYYYIKNEPCNNSLDDVFFKDDYNRVWKQNNKEKLKQYRKQYKEKHPHKYNPDGSWKKNPQS